MTALLFPLVLDGQNGKKILLTSICNGRRYTRKMCAFTRYGRSRWHRRSNLSSEGTRRRRTVGPSCVRGARYNDADDTRIRRSTNGECGGMYLRDPQRRRRRRDRAYTCAAHSPTCRRRVPNGGGSPGNLHAAGTHTGDSLSYLFRVNIVVTVVHAPHHSTLPPDPLPLRRLPPPDLPLTALYYIIVLYYVGYIVLYCIGTHTCPDDTPVIEKKRPVSAHGG